jgi:hypothetical protein
VRVELFAQHVESRRNVSDLWVLSNDVALGISLNETTWRSADGSLDMLVSEIASFHTCLLTSHIGDEETTIWLGSDLIDNGRENTTVALLEEGAVWVGSVKVESGILYTSASISLPFSKH